jgi:hypothetical protein
VLLRAYLCMSRAISAEQSAGFFQRMAQSHAQCGSAMF